jgi:hypothetical protein
VTAALTGSVCPVRDADRPVGCAAVLAVPPPNRCCTVQRAPRSVSPANCVKFPVAVYALGSVASQSVMRRYRGWLPVTGQEG